MQFLLLLPQLPRNDQGGLLNRGLADGRFRAAPRGRAWVLRTADAVRRHLGIALRRPDPSNPR
jgi:hypothetical protein